MEEYNLLLNKENVKSIFGNTVYGMEKDVEEWFENNYTSGRFDDRTFDSFEAFMLQYFADKLSETGNVDEDLFIDSVMENYDKDWHEYVYQVLTILESLAICYPLDIAKSFIKILRQN